MLPILFSLVARSDSCSRCNVLFSLRDLRDANNRRSFPSRHLETMIDPRKSTGESETKSISFLAFPHLPQDGTSPSTVFVRSKWTVLDATRSRIDTPQRVEPNDRSVERTDDVDRAVDHARTSEFPLQLANDPEVIDVQNELSSVGFDGTFRPESIPIDLSISTHRSGSSISGR